MLDSLLALAPRRHFDPTSRDAFPQLLARLAPSQPHESVRALLTAGHHSRSDVYNELDGPLGHSLPVDQYKRVRRLVDACYCLVVACSLHADTLVVRPQWPSEIGPELLGSTKLLLMQEVAATKRAENLKRTLDTEFSEATSLSWQAIVDFLERASILVGVAAEEADYYMHLL